MTNPGSTRSKPNEHPRSPSAPPSDGFIRIVPARALFDENWLAVQMRFPMAVKAPAFLRRVFRDEDCPSALQLASLLGLEFRDQPCPYLLPPDAVLARCLP